MISLKNVWGKPWVRVLAAGFLLVCLNANPVVHRAILCVDREVAMAMNSIVGLNPTFDRTIGWLSTRTGDAFMLGCLCTLFLIHASRGGDLNEFIRRISFWIWLGVICLMTYCLACASEAFIKRGTPMLVLHPFHNLQTTYGIVFRSCPTSSFPSGHGFAYLFFLIMAWRKYLGMSMVLWCFTLVMLSLRLIAGLHWLSDLLLGSLFLAVLLATLISGTPLKKTYKYVRKGVSLVVHAALNVFKPRYQVLISDRIVDRSASTNYFELHGRR